MVGARYGRRAEQARQPVAARQAGVGHTAAGRPVPVWARVRLAGPRAIRLSVGGSQGVRLCDVCRAQRRLVFGPQWHAYIGRDLLQASRGGAAMSAHCPACDARYSDEDQLRCPACARLRSARGPSDPTRKEMLAYLAGVASDYGADDFEVEEAIYAFASAWHGGQGSNLY